MQTSTIRPVIEQYIQTSTWQRVEEKTDTDEVIAQSVNRALSEACNKHNSFLLPHSARLFILVTLITLTCFSSMAYGAQPLACTCFSIAFGYLCLGANDTAMRIALGYVTMVYMVVGSITIQLERQCYDNMCSVGNLSLVALPALPLALVWGTFTGFGLNPGMTSGLALMKMTATKENMTAAFDSIYPGSSKMFTLELQNIDVYLYWFSVCAFAFCGCYIGGIRKPKYIILLLGSVFSLAVLSILVLGVCHVSLTFLFPLTIFCCWLVGISSLPIGRNLGPEQKPVGLKKVDLIKSILGVHLPGVVIGTLAGYGLLGGSITLDFLNDYFVGLAILVLIFVLCKSCPIYQYFASSGNDQGSCMYRQSDELHTCFKLLVRDFAGQMLYHPLHQPFLPRYGLFVCTFSWKKAERYSLRFAENPEHGHLNDAEDECLMDILFWLKNITMHRVHPNKHLANPIDVDNVDTNDIKDIFMVATHSSSSNLTDRQKALIMSYYKQKIEKYRDIYICIDFDVSCTGVISVENDSACSDEKGIEKLRLSLIKCAKKMVTHCFPDPVPVYFWCWLKEKRDKFARWNGPPCEKLYDCHIDGNGEYMPVYPTDTFQKMIDVFCDIGEVFLTSNSDVPDRYSQLADSYIFYDIQFLIDFMKDIVNIDETKETHRHWGNTWKELKRTGRANKTLLKHHLDRFFSSKNMSAVEDLPLEDRPLIRSMCQLDFIFFVGDQFFLPQLLPVATQITPADKFHDVSELLWEYVFDFQDFDYHHEYVFFRLITKCADYAGYSVRSLSRDVASFTVITDDVASDSFPIFRLSCEKVGFCGGSHNRIYLRTCTELNPQQSLRLLQHVKGMWEKDPFQATHYL